MLKVLARIGVVAFAALASAPCPARAGGDPPPPGLRGGDLAARMERASALRARDVRTLGAALTALGEPGPTRAEDLEFVVEFVAREPSRLLRLLAAESAQRLDALGAARRYFERATSEKDGQRAARCVEAAGQVGAREDAATLLPFLDHASEFVFIAAADALARLGTEADAARVADRALTRAWPVAADHGAWAVLDIVGSRPRAAAIFRAVAGEPSETRTARLAQVEALLEDAKLVPHKWTSPFAAARKVLGAQPQTPRVSALNPPMEGWIKAALAWLGEKTPAESWVVCSTVKSVETADAPTRVDDGAAKVVLSYEDTGLPPEKLAYLLFRHASVLFRKRIGEPSAGRRAWDGAILESWDLCVAGKAHDAGKRGVTRQKFLDRALELRPWETR